MSSTKKVFLVPVQSMLYLYQQHKGKTFIRDRESLLIHISHESDDKGFTPGDRIIFENHAFQLVLHRQMDIDNRQKNGLFSHVNGFGSFFFQLSASYIIPDHGHVDIILKTEEEDFEMENPTELLLKRFAELVSNITGLEPIQNSVYFAECMACTLEISDPMSLR